MASRSWCDGHLTDLLDLPYVEELAVSKVQELS